MQVAPPGGASMDAHGWRGYWAYTYEDKGPDLATSTLDHSVSGIRQPLKRRGAARGDTPGVRRCTVGEPPDWLTGQGGKYT